MPNLKRQHTARTPLFRSLQRLLKLAHVANGAKKLPSDELVEMQRQAQMNRRHFLKIAGATVALAGSGILTTSCATDKSRTAPRVVIVGGGVAGLNAAYNLKRGGVRAEIFEASKRSGGRIYTAKNLMAPGLTTELGGEFIDSNHEEMLALAKEFHLDLIDVAAESETSLINEAYFFDGAHHTEAEAIEAFRPLAAKIAADTENIEETVDFEHEGGAGELDKMSITQYLDSIGASGWMRKLLDVAFVTEYGRDAGEQSSLNMLFMISTDLTQNEFALLGESDERYKIKGGNQLVTDELAKRVADQIHHEQRLVAIKSRDKGFTLTFDGAKDVEADFVIVTIPFTMLRAVDIQVALPDYKMKAIAELGYGDNAKLMLGCNKRIWRDLGQSGNIYSDEPFQLAWDNSRLQGGTSGGLTLYSGGQAALDVGKGTPKEQAQRLQPGIEKAFSGLANQFNGNVERFHWPTHPFTKAAYACYLPGQWTTIAGAEIKPVGNLFFAGEHCSSDFQGFMNGGAETGKQAAKSVLKALRKRWMFGS